MSILKLPNAGDTATLEITGVEYVEGEYGPQLKFEAGEDILYLPVTSAERQLERIGINDATSIGEKLTFSRAPNSKPGAKPFWNIAKAGNAKPPAAKSTDKKPVSYGAPGFLDDAEKQDNAELAAKVGSGNYEAALREAAGIPDSEALWPEPRAKRDEAAVMLESYLDLTAWVLKRLPKIYEEAGIGMSPESAAASVHTLFIEANKRRLIGRIK